MQALTVNEILKATGGTYDGGAGDAKITDIVIDSRKAGKNSLFVPLEGENTDGHRFIGSAVGAGAAALSQKETETSGGIIIKVADTRRALGDIARYYNDKYRVRTVGLTGSVGKTTTKDLTAAALGAAFKTHKTSANFNNDLGVPLTIFGIEKETEAAVIEMGMNHFGEIDYLSSIAKPDTAIITNIGLSHIENLGSREGIFKAKMEITGRFTEANTLIINGDDDFLKTVRTSEDRKYRIIKFGLDSSNDVYATHIKNLGLHGVKFTVIDGLFSDECCETEIYVKQPGLHNVYNALAAYCAARNLGVPAAGIANGIENCEYTEKRLEIISAGGAEIINDCYNASPDSVKAALGVLSCSTARRKVAILGDMLELGEYAKSQHYAVGCAVAQKGVDLLIAAGEYAADTAGGAKAEGLENVMTFPTTDKLVCVVSDIIKSGDSVLVKASHGMHFEHVTRAITDAK